MIFHKNRFLHFIVFFFMFNVSSYIVPSEVMIKEEKLALYQQVNENNKLFNDSLFTRDYGGKMKENRKKIEKLPSQIANIAKDDEELQCVIADHACSVELIIDEKVLHLMEDFLAHKKKWGSNVEKQLYENMTLEDFAVRLMKCRAVIFCAPQDNAVIRDGKNTNNKTIRAEDFVEIGKDEYEYEGCKSTILHLKDYISYDEMQVGELLGVASETFFINKGDRNNDGLVKPDENHQKTGIIVGMVGPRHEKINWMSWQHNMITENQNKVEKGYGKDAQGARAEYLRMWANFYGLEYFPTHKELSNGSNVIPISDQYIQSAYNNQAKMWRFCVDFYKKRISISITNFLNYAQAIAQKRNQQAYCHVVGLGLSVKKASADTGWAVDERQEQYMLEVYADMIKAGQYPNIATIDFSWFKKYQKCGTAGSGSILNGIEILFSERNLADLLTGKHEDKLLIAMYAWDANAAPGNEFYTCNFRASGDPAAAACSTISQLQNIHVNPRMELNIRNKIADMKCTSNKKSRDNLGEDFSAHAPVATQSSIKQGSASNTSSTVQPSLLLQEEKPDVPSLEKKSEEVAPEEKPNKINPQVKTQDPVQLQESKSGKTPKGTGEQSLEGSKRPKQGLGKKSLSSQKPSIFTNLFTIEKLLGLGGMALVVWLFFAHKDSIQNQYISWTTA